VTARGHRRWSGITVTDQFCGAGGSTIGAKRAGVEVRLAMNHWDRAVETYNSNHPDTEVHCADVSAQDPRRFPSTDLLITSPECTTHSPAGGNRRAKRQQSLFTTEVDDPAFVRSRATMWDVPRFAEYHEYNCIIAENVVEVTRWPLFRTWLQAMDVLGYDHQVVSLNSMFCHPTPQSRDRVYIVFWKKGNRKPDLDIRPPAPCPKCERVVEARQTWKNGRTIGKYRFQYVFTCSECRTEVTPLYYAALNAIDFTLAAERIGDRARPLKLRTRQRIEYGLQKYGNRHLIIRTNFTSGLDTRVKTLSDPMFAQTASWLDGIYAPFDLASPMVVETAYSHSGSDRVRSVDEQLPSQSARQTLGFAFNVAGRDSMAPLDGAMPTQETREKFALCFLAALRGTDESQRSSWASSLKDAIGTVSAGGIHHALIGPGFAPFITMRRGRDHAVAGDDSLPTVTTGATHHVLVQGAAQLSMRDAAAMRVAGLERELMTQGGAAQQALIQNAPFLTSYYGNHQAAGIEDPVDTVNTKDRHALVKPAVDVDDCYFRMLQPHEIGAAMAFPGDYTVTGNKRDQVKQYGNAVTPPAMDELVRRVVASLAPETAQ
jgi:DNA (cytosine-5)-methyltransferase 1